MMNDLQQSPYTRRQLLQRAGSGFGMLGLAGTLAGSKLLAADAAPPATPLGLHHAPKAKRVIFLFMNGAPSHVDTFDPKPALAKYEGRQPTGKLYRKSKGSGYMPSPFRFKKHGQSGVEVSELFPHVARHIDDICVLRSMHTDVPNHEPGLMMMHAGNQQPIRPSLGSWLSYGLGSENENLPGFIALCPGRPVVGPQLWSSGFLPGEHQGTAIDTKNMQVERLVANIKNPHLGRPEQRRQIDLLQQLNRLHLAQRDDDAALDAQIRAMELAFAMQFEAMQAFDINREPQHIRKAYGSSPFANSCLLARRLVEHGVRYVQVYYVTGGKQPWDTHKDNAGGLRKLCKDSDQPIAALLADLKARGLLEDTLVVWGGEFGRTPYSQSGKGDKKAGRDHHHTGFSMWMAGGGIRGGMAHGATDEFGMKAVEKRMHVHDLHATILHLMGIDHERLTYRYSGRDFRLTDVHGKVVREILA
jgi:hypothetical protein